MSRLFWSGNGSSVPKSTSEQNVAEDRMAKLGAFTSSTLGEEIFRDPALIQLLKVLHGSPVK